MRCSSFVLSGEKHPVTYSVLPQDEVGRVDARTRPVQPISVV
jgi:hypothetical protein